MSNLNQEELESFKAITSCDMNTARKYILKYPTCEAAIDAFFADQESGQNQNSSNDIQPTSSLPSNHQTPSRNHNQPTFGQSSRQKSNKHDFGRADSLDALDEDLPDKANPSYTNPFLNKVNNFLNPSTALSSNQKSDYIVIDEDEQLNDNLNQNNRNFQRNSDVRNLSKQNNVPAPPNTNKQQPSSTQQQSSQANHELLQLDPSIRDQVELFCTICSDADIRTAEAFVRAYPDIEKATNAYFDYESQKSQKNAITMPTPGGGNGGGFFTGRSQPSGGGLFSNGHQNNSSNTPLFGSTLSNLGNQLVNKFKGLFGDDGRMVPENQGYSDEEEEADDDDDDDDDGDSDEQKIPPGLLDDVIQQINGNMINDDILKALGLLDNPTIKQIRQNKKKQAQQKVMIQELPLQDKKSYKEVMKNVMMPTDFKNFDKTDPQVRWPKYIGSIVVDCRVTVHTKARKVKEGDPLQLKASDIDYGSTNQTVKKNVIDAKGNKKKEITQKKKWFIRGRSLNVEVLYNGSQIGFISCQQEEIFVFLLTLEYISIKAIALQPMQDLGKFKMQLDIFLEKACIDRPLNFIAKQNGRKAQGKGSGRGKKNQQTSKTISPIDNDDDLDQDEDTQKNHQMLRATKESFIKLFALLQIPKSINTFVVFKQRHDPLKVLLRDKYGQGYSFGQAAELITSNPNFKALYQKAQQQAENASNEQEAVDVENYYRLENQKLEDSNSFQPDTYVEEIKDSDEEEEDNTVYWDDTKKKYVRSQSIKTTKPAMGKNASSNRKEEDHIAGQNSNDFNLYEPPATLKSELHEYQKQALQWMMHREGVLTKKQLFSKNMDHSRQLHDLYQEMELLDNSHLYFNPFNGNITVEFPPQKSCQGGILADEMGLGKTVMAISLIHSHRRFVSLKTQKQKQAQKQLSLKDSIEKGELRRSQTTKEKMTEELDDTPIKQTFKKVKLTPKANKTLDALLDKYTPKKETDSEERKQEVEDKLKRFTIRRDQNSEEKRKKLMDRLGVKSQEETIENESQRQSQRQSSTQSMMKPEEVDHSSSVRALDFTKQDDGFEGLEIGESESKPSQIANVSTLDSYNQDNGLTLDDEDFDNLKSYEKVRKTRRSKSKIEKENKIIEESKNAPSSLDSKMIDDNQDGPQKPKPVQRSKTMLERKDSFEGLEFGQNTTKPTRVTRQKSNTLKRKYYDFDQDDEDNESQENVQDKDLNPSGLDEEENDFSKDFFNEKENDDDSDYEENSKSKYNRAKPKKSKSMPEQDDRPKRILKQKSSIGGSNRSLKRKDSFDDMGFGDSKIEALGNKAGTLVIVPVNVLSQWESEVLTHSNDGTMSVIQYHGSNRKGIRLQEYDVVITTYGIVEGEYKNDEGIFKYEWFRIILDEAHNIKSRVTKTTKASYALKAEYRWCLTGTPLQNKLDDLFSILCFLKVETWGEYFWWNSYINKNTSDYDKSEIARSILKPLFLRRTKRSTYRDGRNILTLPDRDVRTVYVKMNKSEKAIYQCFFSKGKSQFNDIVTGGTLKYEFAHIFELLTRLRQVCDHPCMVFKKDDILDGLSIDEAVTKFLNKRAQSSLQNKNNKKALVSAEDAKQNDDEDGGEEGNDNEEKRGLGSEFIAATIQKVKNKELDECPVCLDDIESPAITSCGHIFCKDCLFKTFESNQKCPLCTKSLNQTDLLALSDMDPNAVQERSAYIDSEHENFKPSSKIIAVIEEVKKVKEKGEKCVIFSQFVKMMRLVEKFLGQEGITFGKIDGSQTSKNRTKTIEAFKSDKSVTAIVISLKAGAVGLNLTVANHVFLLDPWWNPAIEDQAIERIHRIGQTKNVNIVRFCCKQTIEERILQLNEKKKRMIKMTLSYNPEDQKKQNMENMVYVMGGFDEEEDDDDDGNE